MELAFDALIIGSGAGGAVSALHLAQKGLRVGLVEEGAKHSLSDYGASAPEAMRRLYRRRGMTPILGNPPIGYVEGRCYGGSTEINSGFWHRTPRETLLRWQAQFDLEEASESALEEHFDWAESILKVSSRSKDFPKTTRLFEQGVRAMGWSSQETPRAAHGCQDTNACAHGCPKGAKQGMSQGVLKRVEKAGVTVISRCRAQFLLFKKRRVSAVLCTKTHEDNSQELIQIKAENVFVCCGPTETPSLLRRSGVRFRVGDTLSIHPMLKVVAHYPEPVHADKTVLPLMQVKEFWPDITLGGAFFTQGHVAMALGDNWAENRKEMEEFEHLATYYVAVKGSGAGKVRPSIVNSDVTNMQYHLSADDIKHLSVGLARISMILLASGVKKIYPGVSGLPRIQTEIEAAHWLDDRLNRKRLSLTTVHAFSTCPMGERIERCATDSFGKVRKFENLYVNDASLLPDSPGVNPQGSVMAFARRNIMHFLSEEVRV